METGLAKHHSATPSVNGFFEYLLIVSPDEAVYEQVMAEKKIFTQEYRVPVAVKTKPHITVANFMAKEEMESTMIRWMHRVISMQKRFKVTLDKYNGFPPHTIYLRVKDHEPFKQLTKELKVVDQYLRSNSCPPVKMISCPHISIAGKLEETVYREAERVYAGKEFNASFEVDRLLLLRREHAFDACKQVSVFGLQM